MNINNEEQSNFICRLCWESKDVKELDGNFLEIDLFNFCNLILADDKNYPKSVCTSCNEFLKKSLLFENVIVMREKQLRDNQMNAEISDSEELFDDIEEITKKSTKVRNSDGVKHPCNKCSLTFVSESILLYHKQKKHGADGSKKSSFRTYSIPKANVTRYKVKIVNKTENIFYVRDTQDDDDFQFVSKSMANQQLITLDIQQVRVDRLVMIKIAEIFYRAVVRKITKAKSIDVFALDTGVSDNVKEVFKLEVKYFVWHSFATPINIEVSANQEDHQIGDVITIEFLSNVEPFSAKIVPSSEG